MKVVKQHHDEALSQQTSITELCSSGGSSMGHVGQCPPKENVEMTFLHSN